MPRKMLSIVPIPFLLSILLIQINFHILVAMRNTWND